MNDTEWYNHIIKEAADGIRQGLEGGWLYGCPVDLTNEDVVLVAAYFSALHKAQLEHTEDLKQLG